MLPCRDEVRMLHCQPETFRVNPKKWAMCLLLGRWAWMVGKGIVGKQPVLGSQVDLLLSAFYIWLSRSFFLSACMCPPVTNPTWELRLLCMPCLSPEKPPPTQVADVSSAFLVRPSESAFSHFPPLKFLFIPCFPSLSYGSTYPLLLPFSSAPRVWDSLWQTFS